MHRILPNFVYSLKVTRSRFGLLAIIFCKFVTELWPLIDVRILFLLNIFRKNGQNLTNFLYTLILTRSRLGFLTVIFRKFEAELRPLIDVRMPFPHNILRTNGQNWTKFCIHINIDKI